MNWLDAAKTMLKPVRMANRIGLITDLDGTLSHIVPVPDAAQITPRNRELLASLHSKLALVAVVSGRSVIDLVTRVDLPGLVYVGNHGLERWVNGQTEIAPEISAYRSSLEAAYDVLQSSLVSGMEIEDKGATLSVHYRRTPDPQAVATSFEPKARSVADQFGLNLFHGRMVFELRPPVEVNKGTAFKDLVNQHALDAAVFLGDDTTDVDALRMAQLLREQQTCYCVGLGVLSDGTPDSVRDNADLLVSGVSDVETFLAWLLKACSALDT
jgi:trehalose 6-phosphate phosphatase